MGRMTVCDKCGGAATQKREMGDYCDSCVEDIDTFIEKRDRLHTEVSEKWNKELEKLEKRYVRG